MGHITNQERHGLEELFRAIDHSRYDSKLKTLELMIRNAFKHVKLLVFKTLHKQ